MTRRLLWIVAALLVVGAGLYYGLRLAEGPPSGRGPIELDRPAPTRSERRMDIEAPERRPETAPPERPEGATVTGRIVDRNLVPVEGARLELREGNPLGLAGVGHLPRLGNHRAESDAYGLFAFTEVPPTGELVLHAEGEFAEREAGPWVVAAGELVDVGDVVVDAGLLVHGTVFGPDGERVPRAQVALHDVFVRNVGADLPDPLRVVLTDREGRYEIPHVPHMAFNLVVSAEGYAGAVAEQQVVPDRGFVQLAFDVVLQRPVPLLGTVVDAATGRPIGGAEIAAHPTAIGSPPGLTRSADDGTFGFTNLVPGRYNVWCDVEGYGRKGQIVTADDWGQGVQLRLDRAARIRGTVVTPEGEPVRAFDLLTRRSPNKNTTGSPIGPFERVRDDGGVFEVVDLEAGFYQFEVWAKGYAVTRSEPVRLKRGEGLDGVVVTLQPSAGLEGRIVDDTGAPVAGARVSLHPNRLPAADWLRGGEPEAVWMKAVNSARDGTFAMPDVTEAVYQVQVTHSSYPIVRRDDVAVTAGKVTSMGEILVPRPATLRGTVVDHAGIPVVEATVYVNGEGTSRQVRSNGRGEYVVDRLIPGLYLVTATPARPTLDDVRATFQAELQRVVSERQTGVRERLELFPGQVREHLVTLD